ncbi:MAG TPA: ATP-binding protein, partial [Chthoniobacteraceae bacterium]|nr:ATP-binding protein [Chthoniobacteraceae bacterium]
LAERFQPEAETAAELHELLKDAVVQARNIARGIAPVHMDEAGLASGLEDLAAGTRRIQDIDCTFLPAGEVLVEDRETAIHLYRIAQEAISNAVRHGQATKVVIRLALTETEVTLAIEDNGSGLAAPDQNSKGMGLRSMRYRASVLDGSFELNPIAGGGTRVCCRVPLNKAQLHAN